MLLLLMLDYLGTFAFAASGALKGARKRMDIFGMAVLAVVTAIGGGTTRDLLLNEQPFWLKDINYLLLALLATVDILFLYRLVTRFESALVFFDAIGLGVFTVIGASRAIEHEMSGVMVVTLACLTGVGGGIIRDVLARDVPLIFQKEIYASATIIGATLFWLLIKIGVPPAVAMPVTAALVTTVRLLSVRYGFSLPRFHAADTADDDITEHDPEIENKSE